jgi:hypothetical protein
MQNLSEKGMNFTLRRCKKFDNSLFSPPFYEKGRCHSFGRHMVLFA